MIKPTVLLFLLLGFTSAFKILVVFPYPGKSHSILGEGFVKRLLNAGHEVTYVTPILMKDAPKLRQVDVSPNVNIFKTVLSHLTIENVLMREDELRRRAWLEAIKRMANQTLWNPNVQKLILDTDENFDLVVAEWVYTEVYSGFATVFNCPLAWSSSIDPHGLVLALIDEEPNPAYTSNHMSTAEPPFTFAQRLESLWNMVHLKCMKWFIYEYENKVFQDGYGPAVTKRGRTLPSLYEVSRNASVMFGNFHVSLGRVVSLPQNYIQIAGYHIDDEVKPLPEKLQKIMDAAEHGVIYFSMGSMIKSSSMPEELKKGILNTLGNLKQTVIWKFEEMLPNRPKNVHIVKWAPQQSILAHKNCILFVSHGGYLSITEALHFGVPIIGIPMFANQFINVDRAVNQGFALRVNIKEDMHVDLKAALKEFLENPSYRKRMKELSFVYHHRIASPGSEIVHWVDHVVRTKGAPHLRSPALNVPLYQKMYLDLAAVAAFVAGALYTILTRLFCKSQEKKLKIN